MILMQAPVKGATFTGMPSGSTYVADSNGLIYITNNSVADQSALTALGCFTVSPFGTWGTFSFNLLSDLYSADLATNLVLPGTTGFPAHTTCQVMNDPTTANNGTWYKTGTGNGSGNWTYTSALATSGAVSAANSASAAAASATSASTSAASATSSATSAATSATSAASNAAVAAAAVLGLPYFPFINASTAAGGSNILPQGIISGTIGGTAITGATVGTYPLTPTGGSFTGVTANLVVTSSTAASIVIINPGRTTSASPTAPTWANPSGATLPGGTTLTANIGTQIASGTGAYYLTSNSAGTALLYWQNTGTGAPVAVVDATSSQVSVPLQNGVVNYLNALFVPDATGLTLKSANFVPLAVDAANQVALWLEYGLINTTGLAPALLASIQSTFGISTYEAASGGLVLKSSGNLPLAYDSAGDVSLWLENGLLGAAGLAPELSAQVIAANAPYSASKAQKVIATDGRSLTRYAAALSSLKAGNTAIARVMMIGDSWIERNGIPQAVSTLLTNNIGKSGEGFIGTWATTSGSLPPLNGVVQNWSGWSIYDMADNSTSALTLPTYGCGPDGVARYTSSAGASWTLSNLTTTSLKIYYWDGNGTFRYSIDGGSYTTVTCGNTGTIKSVAIIGLANTTHTLNADTTGNTGTVSILGHLAERPAVGGVTLHRVGNGGSQGLHYSAIKAYLATYSADLLPDVVIIVLGINDYRLLAGTTEYLQGISDIITAVRTNNTNAGIILMHPAQCAVQVNPAQSLYRDAMMSFAIANGCEFYSMFDEWQSNAIESANGQFFDSLHINDSAAYRPARSLMKYFLGVYQ